MWWVDVSGWPFWLHSHQRLIRINWGLACGVSAGVQVSRHLTIGSKLLVANFKKTPEAWRLHRAGGDRYRCTKALSYSLSCPSEGDNSLFLPYCFLTSLPVLLLKCWFLRFLDNIFRRNGGPWKSSGTIRRGRSSHIPKSDTDGSNLTDSNSFSRRQEKLQGNHSESLRPWNKT